MLFTEFGRKSEYWFFSYLEDNFLPFPFFRKTENEKVSPQIKQKSWKRRTDLNTFGYFGLLIALTALNVWYTYNSQNPLDGINDFSNTTQDDVDFSLQANCSSTGDSSKIETLCINRTSSSEGKIE